MQTETVENKNDSQAESAQAGSVQRVVLLHLVQDWKVDERQCRETAENYRIVGDISKTQQLNAQAFGLRRCIEDIEKAMQQNVAGEPLPPTPGTDDKNNP